MDLYDVQQGTELSSYCHEVLNSLAIMGLGSIPTVSKKNANQMMLSCSPARFISESPAMAGLLRLKTGRDE